MLVSLIFIKPPTRQYLTHDHFIVGGGVAHKSRLMNGCHKKCLVLSAFLIFGVSQAQSEEFSPTKLIMSGGGRFPEMLVKFYNYYYNY